MAEAHEIPQLATTRCDAGAQDVPDVRLALRTLQFCNIPRKDCLYFWSGATADSAIGRAQTMQAALNRMKLIRDGKPKVERKGEA